jgi:hypothetical protein
VMQELEVQSVTTRVLTHDSPFRQASNIGNNTASWHVGTCSSVGYIRPAGSYLGRQFYQKATPDDLKNYKIPVQTVWWWGVWLCMHVSHRKCDSRVTCTIVCVSLTGPSMGQADMDPHFAGAGQDRMLG